MDSNPAETPTRLRLRTVLAVAFFARVLAGFAVQRYVGGKNLLCVFGDTPIYWLLARSIRTGRSFVVEQFGIPHYALRTPGYPGFLALCQLLIGENPQAIRLIQALLHTGAVGFVYVLVRRVCPNEPKSVGIAAASIIAVEPYVITASALLLSEGMFIPLMMLMLVGLAKVWNTDGIETSAWFSVLVGIIGGLAILTRPSWLLFVPVPLFCWMISSSKPIYSIRQSVLIMFGLVLTLTPWWVRNELVIGKFVPTALWVGASLYDGLSPIADGSSAMEFLAEPDIARLSEIDQDAELRRRAVEFVRDDPGKAAWLSVVKCARYWSPWPNANAFTSPLVSTLSALITVPVFILICIGAWTLRRDVRALVLLGGPIVYFCCLHAVFVSSVRYRVPGLLPAAGLAAVGMRVILTRYQWFNGTSRVS